MLVQYPPVESIVMEVYFFTTEKIKTKTIQVRCTNLELEAIARHGIFRSGEFEVGLASLGSDHLVALQKDFSTNGCIMINKCL